MNNEDKLYSIRLLKNDREKQQAAELRHQVFTQELGWVESIRTERDQFDNESEFLGVFENNRLLAHTRITPYNKPWMLDSVFRHLLTDHPMKSQEMAESTRYFVSSEHRDRIKKGGRSFYISELMHQGFFTYCISRGINKVYGVFTLTVCRLLQTQGMPITPLEKYSIINGDKVVAAIVNWAKLKPNRFIKPWTYDLFRMEF